MTKIVITKRMKMMGKRLKIKFPPLVPSNEMQKMPEFTPFHEVINERVTNPDAFYYADPWWAAEIKQFILDLDVSIRFIKEECSDEELWWLGEIFDDLVEATRSEKLLQALRERVQLVSNAEWKKDLLEDIRTASAYIE